MKRVFCFLLMLALCVSMVAGVSAANFVPSISYKDKPEVKVLSELLNEEEEVIHKLEGPCLEITSVAEAAKIPVAERSESDKLLLEVYDKLTNGTMKLPFEADKAENMVIRDLIDASLVCDDYHKDPNHVEELAKPSVYIQITFDLGVKADTEVVVMTYIDGQWAPIHKVTNNGDGTVTCMFEEICPVAFCVEEKTESPKTGDVMIHELMLWIALMVCSFAAVVALLLTKRRRHKKSH